MAEYNLPRIPSTPMNALPRIGNVPNTPASPTRLPQLNVTPVNETPVNATPGKPIAQIVLRFYPQRKNDIRVQKYRDEKIFTDIILQVEGEQFPVHRLVLSENSEFFARRFTGEWKSSVPPIIEVKGVTREIFRMFYAGIYGENMIFPYDDPQLIIDFIQAIQYFDVPYIGILTDAPDTMNNYSSLNRGVSEIYDYVFEYLFYATKPGVEQVVLYNQLIQIFNQLYPNYDAVPREDIYAFALVRLLQSKWIQVASQYANGATIDYPFLQPKVADEFFGDKPGLYRIAFPTQYQRATDKLFGDKPGLYRIAFATQYQRATGDDKYIKQLQKDDYRSLRQGDFDVLFRFGFTLDDYNRIYPAVFEESVRTHLPSEDGEDRLQKGYEVVVWAQLNPTHTTIEYFDRNNRLIGSSRLGRDTRFNEEITNYLGNQRRLFGLISYNRRPPSPNIDLDQVGFIEDKPDYRR